MAAGRLDSPVSGDTRPLETQLAAGLEELHYPIEDETDLATTFPSWSSTRFGDEDRALTPRELLLLVPDEYPYESADDLVAVLTRRLREEGFLEGTEG